MSGFFQQEMFKPQSAEEKWLKSEVDRVLDLYFTGMHPREIAQKMGRTPKAVNRIIEQFRNNERDRAIRYEPKKRISRVGKRWTENEREFLRAHAEKKVPIQDTLKVLAREIKDLPKPETTQQKTAQLAFKAFAPTIDLIWAHRYIHFVYKTPIITDETYDAMVKEEIEYGAGERAFLHIKEHRGWPEHIKSLALYLFDKSKQ